MRVVAGDLRGRRLEAPRGTATRPTTDRVREATFNALGSLGALDGGRALDLFAGSGALGIEALSRGLDHVTFVERDRGALATLRANLERCGLGPDRATVVVGDGPALVAAGRLGGPWDLALLDPPYGDDGWEPLLTALDAEVAVCEAAAEVAAPEGWEVVRAKRYGGTVVTIVRRSNNHHDRAGERGAAR